MSEFDKWAAKKYPNASRKDSLGAFSRDLMKSAREGWDAHAELATLKAGEGEAVEVVAWRSERYICGESHYSLSRLTFEQPYSTDRNCEPLMTVAQHERIVAAITAPPASADAVSVPREMAARLCSTDNHVRQTARRELRNMLAAQGVKP